MSAEALAATKWQDRREAWESVTAPTAAETRTTHTTEKLSGGGVDDYCGRSPTPCEPIVTWRGNLGCYPETPCADGASPAALQLRDSDLVPTQRGAHSRFFWGGVGGAGVAACR